MTEHVLERLAATNPDCEIWLDSSPLVYQRFVDGVLAGAPDHLRAEWEAQLTRFLNESDLARGRMGFGGVTTNPPLMLQAILADPDRWIAEIRRIADDMPGAGVEAVYWTLYLGVVAGSAAMILPVWERTDGRRGFLSGQVDPRFVTDEALMLAQGLELAAQGPNVMVKIPGSAEGYRVIEALTARGIPTNNTTSFSVSQYVACMDAVSRGLDRARADGVDLSRWRSVVTHMSSRLGHTGDLHAQAETRGIDLTPDEVLEGEIAVMKRGHAHARDTGHPSKMLMCSMRLQDPGPGGTATSGHIERLAGGDIVYTCPPGYIAALTEAGDRFAAFDPDAIDMEPDPATIEKLRRLPYFCQAYDPGGMRPEGVRAVRRLRRDGGRVRGRDAPHRRFRRQRAGRRAGRRGLRGREWRSRFSSRRSVRT